MERLRVSIHGAVQGVGFRPFLHRLAAELKLKGWVCNSAQGVLLEVEGPEEALREFLVQIPRQAPARSIIHGIEPTWLPAVGFEGFEIRTSRIEGAQTVLPLPDIATCPECRSEIFDPENRRYRYPFTNCTHCGPRFTIIESLPYDRPRTSMRDFTLCPRCRTEYEDPGDRRFHAQPNACPDCGPQLTWRDSGGTQLATREEGLALAAEALRDGAIVAVKGIGGYHLMVDACNEQAIRTLRERKLREEKPFAVMVADVADARNCCEVSDLEQRLLESPEAPIVLLKRRSEPGDSVHSAVAPGNPYLGLMLPSTPLHHLLLDALPMPVVATSGNLSDDPIFFRDEEAVQALNGIADFFLTHDRPILRPIDDSIVTVVAGREMVLRRARGYAPLPLRLNALWESAKRSSRVDQLSPVLAMGAHLKNAIALGSGPEVFVSQHIGDLDTLPAVDRFRQTIDDLVGLLAIEPGQVAADAHPDYASTRHARDHYGEDRIASVQHHHAHALACLAENDLSPPAMAVVWDGTGYGLDETIWGGEFFRVEQQVTRIAHWRTFSLPGGDVGAREPRRSAIGVLWEMFGERAFDRRDLASIQAFCEEEAAVISRMLTRQLNTPLTSSAGRLFDAVASLTGVRQVTRFEGQAAMQLEWLAWEVSEASGSYPVLSRDGILDWEPLFAALLEDLAAGVSAALVSARFHQALVDAILEVARSCGLEQVLLSGGCFQNRWLLENAIERLREEGFDPYWHQRVPPNDGGIALGQVAAVWSKARQQP